MSADALPYAVGECGKSILADTERDECSKQVSFLSCKNFPRHLYSSVEFFAGDRRRRWFS